MKIVSSDFRKGFAKIQVENLDDLWTLSQIIDQNDVLKGKSERKIRIGDASERASKTVKKTFFFAIKAEKIDFAQYQNQLRVTGTVLEGPEDVPKGSYHTFDLEEGSEVTIEKEQWLSFQIKRLKDAAEQKTTKILVCVLDREQATFALLKKYGYDILSEIKGSVQKKAMEEQLSGNFYADVAKQIAEYDKKYQLNKIVLASPAFWKDYAVKELDKVGLKPKVLSATCSETGKNGIDEVLKRPEVVTALKDELAAKEMALVEKILAEISKEGAVAYGIQEVKHASEAGAIEQLLLVDEFILKKRQENNFQETEAIMKLVDSAKGEIHIISAEHDGGKKLTGLGGIAALLRYKL